MCTMNPQIASGKRHVFLQLHLNSETTLINDTPRVARIKHHQERRASTAGRRCATRRRSGGVGWAAESIRICGNQSSGRGAPEKSAGLDCEAILEVRP